MTVEQVNNPKQKHSGYARDGLDWYVEPAWCTELLADQMDFERVWDPACGCGTITRVFGERGIIAIGTDIVDRRDAGRLFARDFLGTECKVSGWTDIVTNPPYKLAEAFIRRAFELEARKIAVLVRLDFLASQGRHKLFTEFKRPSFVFVLSRRPSMPPGELLARGAVKSTSGQHDYCWIVWDALRFDSPTEMRWLK